MPGKGPLVRSEKGNALARNAKKDRLGIGVQLEDQTCGRWFMILKVALDSSWDCHYGRYNEDTRSVEPIIKIQESTRS